MKKNYLLMITLVAVTFLGAGCSKEESSVVKDSNELKITTNIVKPLTKSIVSSFSGSVIGVYVDDVAGANYADNVYHPTTNSTATINAGTNSANPSPSIYINTDAKVYAWYPAIVNELSFPDYSFTKAIMVVDTDDFTATNQTDYLWATPVGVNKDNRTANLSFQHALSKIIFRINTDVNYAGKGILTEISLTTTALDDAYKFLSGNGIMKISDGIISGLTPTSILTYTGSNTLSNTATDMLALVAPAKLAEKASDISTITINLTIDGAIYSASLPISSAYSWIAGTEYTYTITISSGELLINTVSITDWEIGNTGGSIISAK